GSKRSWATGWTSWASEWPRESESCWRASLERAGDQGGGERRTAAHPLRLWNRVRRSPYERALRWRDDRCPPIGCCDGTRRCAILRRSTRLEPGRGVTM